MIRIRHLVLSVTAAALLTACGPTTGDTAPNGARNASNSNANANTNAAKPVAAAPTKEALIAIEKKGWDAWKAFWWTDPATGAKHFGMGLGSLILLANVVCLTGYTLGCHSMRHLVGGFRDQFSVKRLFSVPYACSSCLNRAHHRWAWVSLFMVAFADIYVRLCASGVWTDPRFF